MASLPLRPFNRAGHPILAKSPRDEHLVIHSVIHGQDCENFVSHITQIQNSLDTGCLQRKDSPPTRKRVINGSRLELAAAILMR
ncbi:MAG: hypothetical protein JWR26_1092 [Pedosphaera sp.]|nr:hypothetical protein [Pedosphaera sp.]